MDINATNRVEILKRFARQRLKTLESLLNNLEEDRLADLVP